MVLNYCSIYNQCISAVIIILLQPLMLADMEQVERTGYCELLLEDDNKPGEHHSYYYDSYNIQVH